MTSNLDFQKLGQDKNILKQLQAGGSFFKQFRKNNIVSKTEQDKQR